MYSQIFYIDPHEDVELVKKKLKESHKEKIILVLPEENRSLKNLESFTLLKKEAQILNKKLTIFSTDRHYRQLAEDCGIEIEETLIEAGFFKEGEIAFRPKVRDILPRSELKKESLKTVKISVQKEKGSVKKTISEESFQSQMEKHKRERSVKTGRFTSFLFYTFFFVLVLGGLAFSFLYFPKATIIIIPAGEEIEFSGVFNVEKNGTMDIKTKTVGGFLIEKEKEVEKSFLATGSEKRVDKTKGEVTIFNQTSSLRKFVAGTRFESPEGKIFKSQDYVSIPGGTEQEPGKVEIEVIAAEAGEEYNIGPAVFTLPGLKPYGDLYEKIYAESKESMEGGFIGETKVILKEDTEQAKSEMLKLQDNLLAEAKDEILKEISSILQFLKDEILIKKEEITFDKSEGQIGETFKGKAKIKASLLIPKEEDIQEIIADVVKSKLEEGFEFEEVASTQNIEYKILKSDKEKEILEISFEGKEKVALKIEPGEIKKKIVGMNEEEFRKYIEEEMKDKVQDVEITFWPLWVSKIPEKEDRVFVEIKYE